MAAAAEAAAAAAVAEEAAVRFLQLCNANNNCIAEWKVGEGLNDFNIWYDY